MTKKKKPNISSPQKGNRPEPIPAPPSVAPPFSILLQPLVALGLLLAFWALYYHSIGIEKPNLYWYNFIFDADPARVLGDALSGQQPAVLARHPLFALTIGALASLFTPAFGPRESVLCAVSLIGAGGVATSFIFFRRLCGQLLPALLFALLYGFSAAYWVVSSIPETYAANATVIVGVFLMQRPQFAQPVLHKLRFGFHAMFAALGLGIAVPNIVYPTLGYLNSLRSAQETWLRRVRVLLGYAILTCGLLVILSAAQRALFPGKVPEHQILSAPLTAVRNDSYLRFDRPFVASEALPILRIFVADNLVAPPARISAARVADGPSSMLQYGGPPSALYLTALLGLIGVVVAVTWRSRPRELLGEPVTQLATGFIAYNIVFHYFYRGNGQPFTFSAHTAFPLLVVFAGLFARSTLRFRTEFLTLVTLLVTANNASFLRFVNTALALPCDHQVGNVCLAWPGRGEDPRYNHGVAEFQRSADYPFELGRVEYTQGRFAESIPPFQKALELDPQYLLTRLYLGAALMEADRLDEAIEHLTQSLQRYPGNPKLEDLLSVVRRRRALSPPNQGPTP